jgi:hypothetical protein
MLAVGRSFSRVRASSKNLVSPRVADISRKRVCGNVSSGTCHATPRSRSAYQWNSSITTLSTHEFAPSRRAMFARISAVQQRMGASRLTVASPVARPTWSGPNSRHSAIHFSLTSALMGHV